MPKESDNYPPTPELNKMKSVREKSQAIGEFLDWLANEKKVSLAQYHAHGEHCYDGEGDLTCELRKDELYDFHYSIEKLLAEYFEIDLKKVEEERMAILEHIRK
jgi:hypothetical protein